jgi:catechol 2,3-dioxygenase-like lactoylglutathione lyase family enzyme
VLKGIDHIVIVVCDLEAAVASYGQLGFTLVRGGGHPIGSHNALIAFVDGTYIELIAFLEPGVTHPRNAALAGGGGLVDYCMATHDLRADVNAFRLVSEENLRRRRTSTTEF